MLRQWWAGWWGAWDLGGGGGSSRHGAWEEEEEEGEAGGYAAPSRALQTQQPMLSAFSPQQAQAPPLQFSPGVLVAGKAVRGGSTRGSRRSYNKY